MAHVEGDGGLDTGGGRWRGVAREEYCFFGSLGGRLGGDLVFAGLRGRGEGGHVIGWADFHLGVGSG